jgi:N-methylhydantoinase B
MRLEKGDIIRLETSGGGGNGDPAQRSREAVRNDIEAGYITAEGAALHYGAAP